MYKALDFLYNLLTPGVRLEAAGVRLQASRAHRFLCIIDPGPRCVCVRPMHPKTGEPFRAPQFSAFHWQLCLRSSNRLHSSVNSQLAAEISGAPTAPEISGLLAGYVQRGPIILVTDLFMGACCQRVHTRCRRRHRRACLTLWARWCNIKTFHLSGYSKEKGDTLCQLQDAS